MKTSDFFNKMPCIVDMNACHEPPTVKDDDTIVRVEYGKTAYPYYKVYFLRRIYNDDRIYKCKATFKRLPETAQKWISRRVPWENGFLIRWEGDEENTQLRFDMRC